VGKGEGLALAHAILPFEGFLTSFIRSRPQLKTRLMRCLQAMGYETADWVRIVMYRSCFDYVKALDPSCLDVLEVSAGPQWRREFNFRSYEETGFPEFDICLETLPSRYDLIVADQVFEHLPYPARAARNIFEMLKPGGRFIIAAPFLVRVHNVPIDCNRWTETGLSFLLQEAGFDRELIQTHSWGNRACLIANLKRWRKRGFMGSLRNEPNFPVMAWAFARKAA
jgi:SAM-dependent methyltransferase